MIETYLYEQNIHWQGIFYNTGTRRELLEEIVPLLKTDQILAISGIRRCGKSFLLKQILNHLIREGINPENILFVNLELPAFFGQPAAGLLDSINETYKKIKNPAGRVYLFLDEIQTLPGWETWIKYQYDLHKGDLKIILTGSNSQLLSAEFASLLSGRLIEKTLYPFSFREKLVHAGVEWNDPQTQVLQKSRLVKEFDQYLKFGGMPEIQDIEEVEIKRELLSSYFSAIIYNDILPRFRVRQGRLLHELALYLLGQISDLYNLKKLADYFQANRATLKDFISFLETAYLLIIVPKFDFSAKTRQLSLKKCYAADAGFASLLPLRFSADQGKLLENLVLIELMRRYDRVFYYRNQAECDFMVHPLSRPNLVIQVCFELTLANRDREIRGLKMACQKTGQQKGLILTYNQEESFTIDEMQVEVLPVYRWLL